MFILSLPYVVYKVHRYKQGLVPASRGKFICGHLLIHAFILYMLGFFLWELVMVFALLDARGGIQDLGTGFLPLSYLSRPLFRLYCLWRTFTYVGMWIIGIFQLRKSPQGNEMTSPRVNKA